jgi:hypothetical protein
MGYLTKYGTNWGSIPEEGGEIFWVAPAASYVTIGSRSYSASDDNDGLSPERALRTINRAWGLVTANQDETIALLPGTHSAAAAGTSTATSIAANIAGVRMTGIPRGSQTGNPYRKKTFVTCAAADETINVTAANIEMSNFTLLGDVLNTASANLNLSAAANGFYMHDFGVDVIAQTAGTSILGIDATGAATGVCIQRGHLKADGAFGALVDVTGLVDSYVEDCDFELTAGTHAGTLTVGAAATVTIRRNSFFGAGTHTAAINGTGATVAGACRLHYNLFSVLCTVPIDGFSATNLTDMLNNYIATVGAGTGGTLISLNT